MLTPRQLKSYSFQSVGRNAYRASDVDAYMDEVSRSYEQMFHENAEMVKKLNLLADRLAQFRADEDNIRNALVEAQRMKNSIIAEAEEEAKNQLSETRERIQEARESIDSKTNEILDRAQEESDRILAEAQARADKMDQEAQRQAEQKVRGAQKVAEELMKTAQAEYDKQVGSVSDQAEREIAYLQKVREESAKIRQELLNTYSMQMALLQAGPEIPKDKDPLIQFAKTEGLKRPEIATEFTDTEFAADIDYAAYADPEETPEPAAEEAKEEEPAGETGTPEEKESVQDAELLADQELASLDKNLDALIQEAKDVAERDTYREVEETEDYDPINDYLKDLPEEPDETPQADATEDEDGNTYHYFDSEDRNED